MDTRQLNYSYCGDNFKNMLFYDFVHNPLLNSLKFEYLEYHDHQGSLMS